MTNTNLQDEPRRRRARRRRVARDRHDARCRARGRGLEVALYLPYQRLEQPRKRGLLLVGGNILLA